MDYLEALETLKDMLIGNGINDSINDYVDNLILPIKQTLIETSQPLSLSKKYNVRVFHSTMLDEVHEFDTLQAARDYAAKQKDFCLISMAIEEWFGEE